jgi:hypothetical protein
MDVRDALLAILATVPLTACLEGDCTETGPFGITEEQLSSEQIDELVAPDGTGLVSCAGTISRCTE